MTDSVEQAGISKDDYIVCGAAFLYDAEIKYAQNINVDTTYAHPTLLANGNLRSEFSVLSDLGLTEKVEVTDAAGNKTTETMGGVKLLVNKLEQYYSTVRYDVLMQRIKNILERVRAFFNGINIEYELNKLNDGGIFYYDAAENLDKFEREAGKVLKEEIAKIKRDHPFSNILGKEKLQEIFPEQDEHSPILTEIIDAQPLDADGIFPVESVDPAFRKRIFQLFLSNIKSEIMKTQRDEIYKELKRVFLKNMGMSQSVSTEDKAELERSVDKLFSDLCDDQKWAENGFTDLRGELFLLLEVLIKNPLSPSRITKVFNENNFRRLSSLADYYAKFDPSVRDDIRRQRWTEFFTRILLQQGTGTVEAPDVSAVDIQNRLQTFFESTRQKGFLDGLEVNDLPLEIWAQELAERGKTFQEVNGLKADFEECMRETDGWRRKPGDDKNYLLRVVFEDYIDNCNGNPAAVPLTENRSKSNISPAEISFTQINEIFNSNRISITTPRDMVNVLNADIRNLRAFISGALINALNIEGGFISLIIKEVDRIRFARNTDSGKALVRMWVTTYTRKIRAADFDSIESKRIKNERRNTIATAIKDALNELTLHI